MVKRFKKRSSTHFYLESILRVFILLLVYLWCIPHASAQISPTKIPTPSFFPTSVPTFVPTSPPISTPKPPSPTPTTTSRIPTSPPTSGAIPRPIPTDIPLTNTSSSSSQSGSPPSSSQDGSSTNSGTSPSRQLIILPSSTPTPPPPRVKFMLRLPHVDPSVKLLEGSKGARLTVYRTNQFGRLTQSLSREIPLVLQRVGDSEYFVTSQEVVIGIKPFYSAGKMRQFTIDYSFFIKAPTTIGRLFHGVSVKLGGKTSYIGDCTKVISRSSCGELVPMSQTKSLLGGDVNGFDTSSTSYNVIDIADLEYVLAQFDSRVTANDRITSDINGDMIVDQKDLEIIKITYGQKGDQVSDE